MSIFSSKNINFAIFLFLHKKFILYLIKLGFQGRQELPALGDSRFLAVTYRSGDNTGLALYAQDGDGWKGVWTYAGGRTMGTEVWERQ